MNTRLVIAVDGPAASGKGTLASKLATHFGLPYLDTGTLYRGVAKKTLSAIQASTGKEKMNPGDRMHVLAAIDAATTLLSSDIAVPDLSTEPVAQAASLISAIPEVRAALIDYQRNFAAQGGGAVLDGRDIGTVICPDATIKLFITADARIRAERRFLQQQLLDPKARYELILADINARDQRDSSRTTAPLKPAKDAIHLDTSKLNVEQAFEAALKIITDRKVA